MRNLMARTSKSLAPLPSEVWENIVSYIPYNENRYHTLSRFCLVSRNFRRFSQPALFSWITDKHDDKRYNVVTRFSKVLWQHKHLGVHVHTIDFSNWFWQDLSNPRAQEIMKELIAVNDEIRKGVIHQAVSPIDHEQLLVPGGPMVYTHHILFLCSLCPNLRVINFTKHDYGSFYSPQFSPATLHNLREINIERTLVGDDEYTINEIAALFSAPNLDYAHLHNFTFGGGLTDLEVNPKMRDLLLHDCWFIGEDFERVIDLCPSLEAFEFANVAEVSVNAAEEWFDDLTPRMVIRSLTKIVAKTLQHLKLDMFYYPRDPWIEWDWVAGSLYRLESLETLSIDSLSVLGAMLVGTMSRPGWSVTRGFVHEDQPLKDFFPKSLNELELTHISANMTRPMQWLAKNIREQMPELKRIRLSFGMKWREDDAECAELLIMKPRSAASCAAYVSMNHTRGISNHHDELCGLPVEWADILRQFLKAGIDTSITFEGRSSWSGISQDMLT